MILDWNSITEKIILGIFTILIWEIMNYYLWGREILFFEDKE